MSENATPTAPLPPAPPVTASRRDLMAHRRLELLQLNASTFASNKPRHRVAPHAPPFQLPPQPGPESSRSSRFDAKRSFRDPDPPKPTYLPRVHSRQRAADFVPAHKPSATSAPRFLTAKLSANVRPNTGTLNEGAPLYSSFTKDNVYRGDEPRGYFSGLSTMGSARSSMGGTQTSRTLIR